MKTRKLTKKKFEGLKKEGKGKKEITLKAVVGHSIQDGAIASYGFRNRSDSHNKGMQMDAQSATRFARH
ncbi:MAG: hypothetical protein OEU50_01205, partial [Gammaproteobacteria bacterium]|nr:hypothetical protein [Gammaproteobacteria bacterium]